MTQDICTLRGHGVGTVSRKGQVLGPLQLQQRQDSVVGGNYGRNPRGASIPGPVTKKLPQGREGTELGKEKKHPEFSAKGVSKIFIQDEMCSYLCTTRFPPQWRALSIG